MLLESREKIEQIFRNIKFIFDEIIFFWFGLEYKDKLTINRNVDIRDVNFEFDIHFDFEMFSNI